MIQYNFIIIYHKGGCYKLFVFNPVFHKNQIIKFIIVIDNKWPKVTLQCIAYIPTFKDGISTMLTTHPVSIG